MERSHEALTLQMLQWISQGNHSYSEVLDVWKSTCPRLTIWEDACIDGFVDSTAGMSGTVSLTEKGKQFLFQASFSDSRSA